MWHFIQWSRDDRYFFLTFCGFCNSHPSLFIQPSLKVWGQLGFPMLNAEVQVPPTPHVTNLHQAPHDVIKRCKCVVKSVVAASFNIGNPNWTHTLRLGCVNSDGCVIKPSWCSRKKIGYCSSSMFKWSPQVITLPWYQQKCLRQHGCDQTVGFSSEKPGFSEKVGFTWKT